MNTKERDSNMELYRIVCMMLVVLFHVCGVIDITNNSLSPEDRSIGMLPTQLITSATFVCVDVFVLLSGWYGIKPKRSKAAAFVYQVLFYSIISYILFLLFCPDLAFSMNMLLHIFILDDYWFVPVYLLLFAVSPLLNRFIKDSSHQEFKTVLLFAFLFQCVYGWIIPKEAGFLEGRSPFSFMLLYLIAAYARRFPISLKQLSKSMLFLLYLASVFTNGLLAYFSKTIGNQMLVDTIYQFSSPFIIFASLCLLLLFSKISISYNRLINWIAASSFAVFLIHCFPLFVERIFWPFIENLYLTSSLPTFLFVSLIFVIILYAGCIFIDQLQIISYKFCRSLFRHK